MSRHGTCHSGVRLINLAKKNDVIASVCKVMSAELEEQVEEESRAQWAKTSESIKNDMASEADPAADAEPKTNDDDNKPEVNFE